MKLIIASDIHGSAFWCRRLCDLIDAEKPDKLILLGDLLYPATTSPGTTPPSR